MSWIPVTESDRAAMLQAIGFASDAELFAAIPEPLRLKTWDLPEGMSELAVRRHLAGLARANRSDLDSFLGGGFYDHFIPAAVDALSSRSEFYTGYTPYQPECSQGTLQSIYEYQSAICRLTGMEYANASLYDGGTAVFEAASMACRITGRTKVILHPSLNPRYAEMVRTHMANLDVELRVGDRVDDAACVIVQNPAFRGTIQDFSELAVHCHEHGALLVVAFYPVSLGLLKTPGEMGADIAVAEGQSLGIPLGFGGPYLGILATRREYVRKMPGRLAGRTQDEQGRRGFVLTLQAREQHIRRGKALSNICSNQALCALRALVYLSLLGDAGLREVAAACHAKAEYLKRRLTHCQVLDEGPTFNEFVLQLPRPAAAVCDALLARGYCAGLPLEAFGGEANELLVAVTEKKTRGELEAFAAALEDVCS